MGDWGFLWGIGVWVGDWVFGFGGWGLGGLVWKLGFGLEIEVWFGNWGGVGFGLG